MCEIVFNNNPHPDTKKIKVHDYNLRYGTTGRTHELMQGLTSEFPDYDFLIVIGLDNALEIEKWYKWKELIHEFPFIIFPRKLQSDYRFYIGPDYWFNKSHHIHAYHIEADDISSTKYRALIYKRVHELLSPKEKRQVNLMHPGVIQYMWENRLYRDL